VKIEKTEPADLLAPMAAEEIDETVGGRDIGAYGVRRAPPVMREVAGPPRRKRSRRMVRFV